MSRNLTTSWVLQNDSTVTLSDYQKRALAESYAKLSAQNQIANEEIQTKYKQARVYELSLKDLGQNWVATMATVSQEIYQWMALTPKERTMQKFMEIIGKEDRMIYVGITLVFASLFMYFMIMP